MKHSAFVHLHVHSEFSILDSTLRIQDMVARAEELHMPALALTDNGVLFGAVEFYETCKKHGIKPIIGMEAYMAPGDRRDKTPRGIADESYPLVLLARNETGYKNLLHLATLAQFEGFYYRPRIDKETLKAYGEGLIILSGSLQGELPALLLQGKHQEARELIQFYKDVAGSDHVYLEIMDHGLSREKWLIEQLSQLSIETQTPLVAANDCHYLRRDDSFAHSVARSIYQGTTINDTRGDGLQGSDYYFKTPDEMTALFKDFPEALSNTLKIAEQCHFEMELGKTHLPEFSPPSPYTEETYLVKLCEEGLKKRFGEVTAVHMERLEHELKIIRQMGFISYFLIVWDFVNYAKQNQIPVGPGRGSAAGSLIAYLLEITDMDPLKHSLLFERFLNPDRISMPDIDIDFCYDNRQKVIEYVSKTYGQRSVAQIITFGTLAARAVIRDVGRVMGIPLVKVDQIAKMVPAEPKMTLKKALDIEPELKQLVEEDQEVEGLFNIGLKLEGLPRNTSTHAAGIIITKGELTQYVGLYRGQNGEVITQLDGPNCEKIGLLKMDFLGLKTLTVLDNAWKSIRKSGRKINIRDLNDLPVDDSKTFDLLNKANTLGVFQLESTGMRDLMKRLGVHEFSDIVALVALYRPGPMQMADDFIQRKHGRIKVEYYHPLLEEVLKETFGIMLYQEQVMQCAQVMADFTLAEADNLRRIMGKKKEDAMKQQREKFIEGAVKKGIGHEIAEKTFDAMEFFAGYGFNKSHSVAYGWIAYQTAWFKANYPADYMASLLSSEKNNMDKISQYIEECRAMKIPVKPPCVQYSYQDFTVEADMSVRYGLSAIKNVGEGAVDAIVEARNEGGVFSSMEDFVKRVDQRCINKKVLESLAKSGALDALLSNRKYLFESSEEWVRFGATSKKDSLLGQESFFDVIDADEQSRATQMKPQDVPPWSEHELLIFEKELLGCYLTGHPLARYQKVFKRYATKSSQDLETCKEDDSVYMGGLISQVKVIKTKSEDKMAVLTMEDFEGIYEVVVYPRLYAQIESLLQMDNLIFIDGLIKFRNGSPNVVAEDLIPMERLEEEWASHLVLRIDEGNEQLLGKLKSLLAASPGECLVLLDLILTSGENVMISSSHNLKVKPGSHLLKEIKNLLGEDAVWIRVRKPKRPRARFKPRQTAEAG